MARTVNFNLLAAMGRVGQQIALLVVNSTAAAGLGASTPDILAESTTATLFSEIYAFFLACLPLVQQLAGAVALRQAQDDTLDYPHETGNDVEGEG